MHYCGGFRAMMDPEEYELAEERIELFSGMDLIGRAIGPAVRSSYRPPRKHAGGKAPPAAGSESVGHDLLEIIPVGKPAEVYGRKK